MLNSPASRLICGGVSLTRCSHRRSRSTMPSSRADERPSPELLLDRHTTQAVFELGEALTQRRGIYLDMNYWINLSNANQNRGTTTSRHLLSILRRGVQDGVVFCPISEAVFLELMKHDDLASRLATAGLIDELSLGATLASETERISTEIRYFMNWATGRRNPYPIEHWVWRKAGYVLGPVRLNPTALERMFFDHMWAISLYDMVKSVDNGQGPDRRINTSEINDETARHADELHNFEQTYNNEAKGIVDAFGDVAPGAMASLAASDGVVLSQPSPRERLEAENLWKHALFFALTRDKARDVLRTLHIDASLHAAFRWDKKRKLRSNDLDDFTHAKAALAYCNAFFTERSLRSVIASKHLGIPPK